MAPAKEKDSRGKNENIKPEDVLQAVVVADSFNNKFGPLITNKPKALLPLVNRPLIEYTLEFLSSAGVKEVFLYCCKHVQLMKSYIEESRWGRPGCHMNVKTLLFEDAHSFGDVLRNLDAQGLVRSDFILLTGDVVANLALQPIVDEHRKRKIEDKGTLMTLLYRHALPGHNSRCAQDETVLAIDSSSKRILQHAKIYGAKKVSFPLDIFQENKCVDLHYDFLDTHISICSPQVPTLFTDNFDYQTCDDFIRGILENEDILGNTVYLHTIQEGYAAPLISFSMYTAISRDLMHRWVFPFAPERSFDKQRCVVSRRNQYKHKQACIGQDTVIEMDVVIGDSSNIGKNCQLRGTVIGNNCIIGDNVTINNAYLWDNVKVKDNCSIETAILSDNVIVEEDCCISRGCVLGSAVHLIKGTKLDEGEKLVGTHCDSKGKQLSEEAFVFSEPVNSDSDSDVDVDPWDLDTNESVSETSCSDEDRDSDVSVSGSPPPDDLKLFYNEVVDSFSRGLEEKVSCENLILEVNSSKYAYNVTMKELNVHIMKATLNQPSLPSSSAVELLSRLKVMLQHLVPLYKNYYRSKDSQQDCLTALEESSKHNPQLLTILIKILHQLYEADVVSEEAILQWYYGEISTDVKTKVQPFISWLEEAEEESD